MARYSANQEAMMNRLMALSMALLIASLQAGAQAEKQLEAARHKEVVDGDLKAAAEQYRKIAAQYAKQPEVAARALYQLGQCQEKLGQAEARKSYERVVKEYSGAGQYAAAAKARLSALSSPSTATSGMNYRQLWTGPKVDIEGTVSPDGRYLSFVSWDTGDLALHDLATNTDRVLTNKGTWVQSGECAEESTISRDGKQIAYAWFNGKDRSEIRVASIPASGVVQPRKLFDSQDVSWIAPYDWSPDGKWVAAGIQRKLKQLEVGLISTSDGSLRVLKTTTGTVKEMVFSPDGKYLGLDLTSDGSYNESKRDVYVLAVDGTGENRAVANPGLDFMMGWSPDGKLLLFASDRTGTLGLWSIAVLDGKSQGAPKLLRPEIADEFLGLSASGALYVGARLNDRDINIASVDFTTGKLLAPPVRPIQTYIGSNTRPDWSPDGSRLSYVSQRNRAGTDNVLEVRSLESGEVHELRPNLKFLGWPRWSPDGRSLLSNGTDHQNVRGIYRIDAQTGEATRTGEFPHELTRLVPYWVPAADRIYYIRNSGDQHALVERELATSKERELIRRKYIIAVCFSPDGRSIALLVQQHGEGDRGEQVLMVTSASGGEPRELLRNSELLDWRGPLSWTADGRSVLATRWTGSANLFNLWSIPIDGGAPRKLDLGLLKGVFAGDAFRVHPDGRRIAYVAGETQSEVSVLENFLPAQTTQKK